MHVSTIAAYHSLFYLALETRASRLLLVLLPEATGSTIEALDIAGASADASAATVDV